ncbi:LysR family transcriptional regulator [Phaeobacter gallaeciensis]|uniref:LysR family transcriptional regulator n=1 Tax=Phaeobacter gallaeciensis TaxID=60890 RepID=UPI002380A37B|nr:LysR family transcriptional regulator [Phaeobacter gallaeciensis]MDE4276754.1 LysR family transcriptional regulator [Phaeobacter gallaeciensis]MDE4301983.1 LysR family transcriptional regulator [Phaeobacter gallaeciensis]MDE5187176.1 LysR family transcriptional regulator [Phaeobacter gallaeciensis]
MLNATWLNTFTTLCEIGHFTRAADVLGMTQPGVSQHLRKLEAQVGKPLIVQEGKSFTPTPAGEALFKVGLARRQQERELKEVMQRDDPDVGEVRIGCSGSFAIWLYPHLLERLRLAPDLALHLTAAPQGNLIRSVIRGDLDLGILAGQPQHPQLEAKMIMREELCLVVPGSMQAQKFDLSDLNNLGFVAHPDGYEYADELLGRNFSGDYQGSDHLRRRTSVNQIGQILTPVAEGLGFTILPRSGVDAFARRGDISILDLTFKHHHELWLTYRRGRNKFARIASVITWIEEKVRELD